MATKISGKVDLKLERKTVVLYELEVIRDGKTIESLLDAAGREVKVIVGGDDEGNKEEEEDK